jgi:hypothetical protein
MKISSDVILSPWAGKYFFLGKEVKFPEQRNKNSRAGR